MGILDFVRSGVKEMMVARPDSAKRFIVYKHPEATIPMYSQLTVDIDEAVVFFRDGSLVGVLRSAGVGQRHTLDSQNIPFLSRLVDSFTGGNVFITDLYFVTMRPIRDTKFGGPLQAMKDPELEITVSPRIFGTMMWQIKEPDRFIVNYLGMGGTPSNDQVESFLQTRFMNSVKRTVPEFVIKNKIEVQALAAYHDELGKAFVERNDDLTDIGVQFLGLGDFTLNFSEDELKRIQAAQDRYADLKVKKRARDELGGGNFMQYAAGEAMLGAGQGMAKGEGGGNSAMAGGMGFGMGAAMAQMYAGQVGQMPGQVPVAQPAPAPMVAPGKVSCGSCGAQVPPGKFCAECGTTLAAPTERTCPSCQTKNPPTSKFCANCGTNMTG